MKNNYNYLFLLLLLNLVSFSGYAQNRETINIDLGRFDHRTLEAGWNNLYEHQDGYVVNLVNQSGQPTGIGIAVTDAFNNINEANGTADDTLGIPKPAARDSFWGSKVLQEGALEPTGGVTLSHLHVGTAYSFAFFGSRGTVTNNRVTKFIVEGATTQEVNLNTSRNTSGMVRVSNMMPRPDGTITVTATTGDGNDDTNGTYFFGAMKVSYEKSAAAKYVNLGYPVDSEVLRTGRRAVITWESSNVATVDIEYTPDGGGEWRSIATAVPAAGKQYEWIVPATPTDQATIRIFETGNRNIGDATIKPFAIKQDDGQDKISIDFGPALILNQVAYSPRPWNNITDHIAGSITNLVNDRGEASGFGIAITERFNATNTNGVMADPALGIPSNASRDNFFGNALPFSGQTYATPTLTITGLRPGADYSFSFYGSRASTAANENRETKYTVTGSTTGSATLAVTDNSTNVATVNNVRPNPDGTITIKVEAGDNNNSASKFTHLNAMTMTTGYRDPLSSASEALAAKLRVYPNPTTGDVFVSTQGDFKIEGLQVLSISGQKVLEKGKLNTFTEKLNVTGLAKGVYIIQIQTNKGQLHSRLVVQ
ncbi:MAG: T9SS type A sorting domain-containing protein [Rufibacter sp.]